MSEVRAILACCALLLMPAAVFGIPCEVYPIPEEFHSGSGYTALACGPDGNVYVGTAMYGGSAHLVRFNPQTRQWQDIINAHAVTRDQSTGLDSQSKFHAKILVDGDGVIWAATKHGNEEFITRPEYGEDGTGFPGGHLFSYQPKTGQVIDHGILKKQEGIMGGAVDTQRKRLYYVSDPKGHFLIYDIVAKTVRDLGHAGPIPRYMAIDRQGRVFLAGGVPEDVPGAYRFGGVPAGAKTPYLCMYDPATDRLSQLAVTIEGPGKDAYTTPYVLITSADGTRLFGNGMFGKYFMEFDLKRISLNRDNPLANGSIICRHIAEVKPAGNQRTGVIGKDGRYYFANDRLIFRYDPARRTLGNLGEIETTFDPNIYPQGAGVGKDGTLYLKYLFPYRLIRFPKLTAPKGGR